ncbi:hypothetical protein [Streptomyces uncialis]|uniref:hypothetical protein n=1 Tax=Streptomyces uncialis TaxID=1048205 RepID=UPI003799948C
MNRRDRDRFAHTDELLRDAEVFTDAFADFDSEAFLERVARRASRNQRAGTGAVGPGARSGSAGEADTAPPGARAPGDEVPALYRRAAVRLKRMSAMVVNDPDMVEAMALFVDGPGIDPAGALTYACLLYLSDVPERAEFWWQFAAGAGVATAAHCLYLHHTTRSETHMAGFWLDQAHGLRPESGTGLYPPIASLPPSALPQHPRTRPAAEAAGTRRREHASDTASGTGQPFSWAMDHAKIADAVLRMEAHTDEDHGPVVPRPDPALAAELEEHLEHITH